MDLWNSCNFEVTNGRVVGLKRRKAKRKRSEIDAY